MRGMSLPVVAPLRFLFLAILLIGVSSNVAVAQDGAGEEAASPSSPAAEAAMPSATDQDGEGLIDVADLKVAILPLRKAELEAVANQWIARLQDKVAELSQAQLEARGLAGEEKAAAEQRIAELTTERGSIINRVRVVLQSLEAKGGDVAEHEAYVDAVAGITIQADDASALWTTFMTWLKSDEGGRQVGLNIIYFVATLIIVWIIAAIIGAIVSRALARVKKTSSLLRTFLAGLARKIVWVVGIVIAISMLGFDIGPLVAAIGAAGLVIGFALQGTLSNFASGILILMYRPYDVGDVVNVAGGVAGTVSSMTLVSTTIKSFDNQCIVVPNNSIWGDVITNVTAENTRRIDMVFGISYADDIDRAREILLDILNSHEKVLKDPEPNVRMHEMADSSVNFICRPWTLTSDYWSVYWDVQRTVKQRFDAEGISIPFPQRDVHIHQAEPSNA